jgi:hypothetical protein
MTYSTYSDLLKCTHLHSRTSMLRLDDVEICLGFKCARIQHMNRHSNTHGYKDMFTLKDKQRVNIPTSYDTYKLLSNAQKCAI